MKWWKKKVDAIDLYLEQKSVVAEMRRNNQVLEEQNAGLRVRLAELSSENWKLRTNWQNTATPTTGGYSFIAEVHPQPVSDD